MDLGEIEALLEAQDQVRGAVAIVREDVVNDKRLVAYVVKEQGSNLEANTLSEALGEKLPAYMVPSHIVFLDKFPLTPNKKVDRKALPAPNTVKSASPASFISPESDLEKTIADIWKSALKIEQIGADENFFDLGGHSLLAVQVHRRLEDIAPIPLSTTDLFRYPTIRALAGYMDGGNGGSEQRVVESQQRADTRKEAMLRRRKRRGR